MACELWSQVVQYVLLLDEWEVSARRSQYPRIAPVRGDILETICSEVTFQAPSRSSTSAHTAEAGGQKMRESLRILLRLTREGRPPRDPHSTCPIRHGAMAPMGMRQVPGATGALVQDALTAPNVSVSPTSSPSGGTECIRLINRDVELGESAVRRQARAPRRRQLLCRLM